MAAAAFVAYGVPLAFAWTIYAARRRRVQLESAAKREAAREAGLTEPATLHPKIDPAICIGCGTCVRACPEGDIIGLIDGKAELVEAANCIGHGACKTACPADAIRLVFGTGNAGRRASGCRRLLSNQRAGNLHCGRVGRYGTCP